MHAVSALSDLTVGVPLGLAAGLSAVAIAGVPLPGLAEPSRDISPRPVSPSPSPAEVQGRARERSERAPEPARRRAVRYVVQPGDTLWSIAAERYRDVDGAIARIKRRNGFRRNTLYIGEVLILPAPIAPKS